RATADERRQLGDSFTLRLSAHKRSAGHFEEEFALRGRLVARLAREAAARGAYEPREVRDRFVADLLHLVERALNRQARAEEELVGALQGGARLRREAAAA